jgi:hypothetical protein
MQLIKNNGSTGFSCTIQDLRHLLEDSKKTFEDKINELMPPKVNLQIVKRPLGFPEKWKETAEEFLEEGLIFTVRDINEGSRNIHWLRSLTKWLETKDVMVARFSDLRMSTIVIPFKRVAGRRVYALDISPQTLNDRKPYRDIAQVRVSREGVDLYFKQR